MHEQSTEAMAKETDLRRMGHVQPTDDANVMEIVHVSGFRTRWLKTMNGYWRKVSSEDLRT